MFLRRNLKFVILFFAFLESGQRAGLHCLIDYRNREPQHTRPHFSVKKRIATQTRFSADLQKYKRHFCEGIIGLLPVLTIK